MPHPHQEQPLLLAAVNDNPHNSQAVFNLAESYFSAGDFAHARFWHARRAEMGGSDEQVFVSLLRFGQSMHNLGQPWPDVQDAYLRAWEYRPTRAEPLHFIAQSYRFAEDFRLGYLFAERAARIPLPNDTLGVIPAIYRWQAVDELGICASWIDKKPESFELFRQLLARPDVPADDRARLAGYCEYLAPEALAAAAPYPHDTIQQLTSGPAQSRRPASDSVTVAIAAHQDRSATERTLNTFLNCCTDIGDVDHFLLVDKGLSDSDRTALLDAYPFLELAGRNDTPGRFLLRLESGWEFFAHEPLIRRLTAVLENEPNLAQVGINYLDEHTATGAIAAITDMQYTTTGTRYVLRNQPSNGPAMVDTTRPHNSNTGYATLDEILCISGSAHQPAGTQYV